MQRWRRLIAIVLLLAFMPSSMLGAMPLVWCVGDDGHRGVEFGISTTVKHLDHHALGAQSDAATQKAADSDGCRDWQLMGKAKVAKAQDAAGLLTFDLRQIIVLPTQPTSLEANSPPTRLTYSNRAPAPDIGRVALRSVVLLI